MVAMLITSELSITGVGTVVAFAIVLSTHRGLIRAVERLFGMLPTPDVAQRPA